MSIEPRHHGRPGPDHVSGWALGGATFAATVLIIIGIFQVIAGLVAIIDDEFYVVARNYTFELDTSAWGWIHLLVGLLVAGCGFSCSRAVPGPLSRRSCSPA